MSVWGLVAEGEYDCPVLEVLIKKLLGHNVAIITRVCHGDGNVLKLFPTLIREISEHRKTILTWAGFGIGTLLVLVARIWEGYQVTATFLDQPLWVWQVIGLTIFFFAVAGILTQYRKESEQRTVVRPPFLEGATPENGVEFFGTIDELRTRHPLPETFKAGNDIHAYFLSGEGVFAEHNDYIRCVRRLILPNPDAANIIATLRTLSSSVDFKSQIHSYRSLARKNNIPVRLFHEFIGVSLLFCNPERQDGWVQVGIIIPGSESAERQHYRLFKPKQERAVLSLYKTFNWLWDRSIEQTEEEAFIEGFEKS